MQQAHSHQCSRTRFLTHYCRLEIGNATATVIHVLIDTTFVQAATVHTRLCLQCHFPCLCPCFGCPSRNDLTQCPATEAALSPPHFIILGGPCETLCVPYTYPSRSCGEWPSPVQVRPAASWRSPMLWSTSAMPLGSCSQLKKRKHAFEL